MIDLTLVILVERSWARGLSVAEWHSYADGNRSPWRSGRAA